MKIKHKKWIAIISSFMLIAIFVVAGVSGVGDNPLLQVSENSNQEELYEANEEEIPDEDTNNYQARTNEIVLVGIYDYKRDLCAASDGQQKPGSTNPAEIYYKNTNSAETYYTILEFTDEANDKHAEPGKSQNDIVEGGLKYPSTVNKGMKGKGYIFQGWHYYDADTKEIGNKVDTNIKVMTDANLQGEEGKKYVEIIEKWSNEYTITLNNSGEGTISSETIQATCDSLYSDALKDVTVTPDEGKTFVGWSYTEGGKTVDVDSTTKVPEPAEDAKTGDHTLYAVWADAEYDLTFNYNYQGSSNPVTVKYGNFSQTDKYADVMSANGVQATPTREGYTFIGWYTSETGGTKVETTDIVSSSKKTLYAHWEEKTYTISYQIGGEKYEGAPTSYKYTTENIVLPIPSQKDGYTFNGWYTNSEFIGDAITEFKPAREKKDIIFYGRYLTNEQEVLYTKVVDIDKASDTMTPLELFNAKVDAVVYYEQKLNENPGFTIGSYYDNIIKGYRNDIKNSNHNSTVGGLALEGIDKWFVRLNVEEFSDSSSDFQRIASQVDADTIIKLYDIDLMDVSSVVTQNKWTTYDLEAGEVAVIKVPQNLFDASGYENIQFIHEDSKTNEIEILDYEIQDGYYVIELSSFSPVGIIADIIEQPAPGAADDDAGVSGKSATGGYTQTGDSLPIFEIAIFVIAGVAILLVVIVKRKRSTH